jgi:hypothetical protein
MTESNISTECKEIDLVNLHCELTGATETQARSIFIYLFS